MKNLTVTVNGVAYNVTVEENTNGAAPVAAAPAAAPAPAQSFHPSVTKSTFEIRNVCRRPSV